MIKSWEEHKAEMRKEEAIKSGEYVKTTDFEIRKVKTKKKNYKRNKNNQRF